MSIGEIEDTSLLALPTAEKLRVIEMLWDALGSSTDPIPLPGWVDLEASRRRAEMIDDPADGLSHEEVWKRIERRHG